MESDHFFFGIVSGVISVSVKEEVVRNLDNSKLTTSFEAATPLPQSGQSKKSQDTQIE